MFDCMVNPVVIYGAEVWAPQLVAAGGEGAASRVHLDFRWQLLGVGKSTQGGGWEVNTSAGGAGGDGSTAPSSVVGVSPCMRSAALGGGAALSPVLAGGFGLSGSP